MNALYANAVRLERTNSLRQRLYQTIGSVDRQKIGRLQTFPKKSDKSSYLPRIAAASGGKFGRHFLVGLDKLRGAAGFVN